jgi:hypothetical protein
MAITTPRQQREIVRLKHAISYYCGVIARTASRERIRAAHAAIRQYEHELERAFEMEPQPREE